MTTLDKESITQTVVHHTTDASCALGMQWLMILLAVTLARLVVPSTASAAAPEPLIASIGARPTTSSAASTVAAPAPPTPATPAQPTSTPYAGDATDGNDSNVAEYVVIGVVMGALGVLVVGIAVAGWLMSRAA